MSECNTLYNPCISISNGEIITQTRSRLMLLLDCCLSWAYHVKTKIFNFNTALYVKTHLNKITDTNFNILLLIYKILLRIEVRIHLDVVHARCKGTLDFFCKLVRTFHVYSRQYTNTQITLAIASLYSSQTNSRQSKQQ